MKLSNNTVLITGGSSGIGFELSKKLIDKGNTVIICGRSEKKLAESKKLVPQLHIKQCDVADERQSAELVEWIRENHPGLTMLVNNAAIVHRINFLEDPEALKKAENEIRTNLLGPMRLIKSLYPLIITNNQPLIINVTTGLAYVPRAIYPFYNASKAALHSFTQVLRHQMNGSECILVEAMFPAVNTPWHKGNPPKIAISVEKAVDELIRGLEKEKEEIRIAGVKLLYFLSRMAPGFAFRKINSLE